MDTTSTMEDVGLAVGMRAKPLRNVREPRMKRDTKTASKYEPLFTYIVEK